jgi:hypothetical protein
LEKHAAANGVHLKYEKGNNYGNTNGGRGGTQQRGRKLSMNDLNWYDQNPCLSNNNRRRQFIRNGQMSRSYAAATSKPRPTLIETKITEEPKSAVAAKTSSSVTNELARSLQAKRRGGEKY